MNYRLVHTTKKKISPGTTTTLGATIVDNGVNFAIYSKYAKEIFLLLFNEPHEEPSDCIQLARSSSGIWHVFVDGIKPGQLYGYKVRGEYDPARGMRFNEHKLLIDPYTKSLSGDIKNIDGLLFGYDATATTADLSFDTRDNTPIVPKSVVVNDEFDWGTDTRPDIPLEKLIIYETHIKGMTAHPSAKCRYPGTYRGFMEKIPYLKNLGINAIELLPVHQFYTRDGLVKLGLTDYWGYNSVCFFAPHHAYSSSKIVGAQVSEFKTLVRELHKAGIEIILDVVYNHTGEGDELGPTLCFRGIDNATYYALKPEKRLYVNDAGCGNTFDVENPIGMRLVLDSLRYWVSVMHVDGFRFDLASILPRVQGRYHKESAFFDAIAKDPILQKAKLIAEPWDLTTYQIGNFPLSWSEWNGKFRDNGRRFIRGDWGQAKELTFRLTGSPDLYGDDGRSPYNSINFITCHDGFTLNDLWSYNEKHNAANGENNKDGTTDNFSWNCGVEGGTTSESIIQFRKQMIKNALCCLLIPLGTPMILGGDEFMRTQNGNNNAYCQDTDTIWFDWDYAARHHDITEFTRRIIAFRKKYTILQKRKFPPGKDLDFHKLDDLSWCGQNLDNVNWDDPAVKTFCCQLDGSKDIENPGAYRLFFILNTDENPHRIALPRYDGRTWYRVIDTTLASGDDIREIDNEQKLDPADFYYANPRCVVGLIGK